MPPNQNHLPAGSRVPNNHSPTVSCYRLINSVSRSTSFPFALSKWIFIINRLTNMETCFTSLLALDCNILYRMSVALEESAGMATFNNIKETHSIKLLCERHIDDLLILLNIDLSGKITKKLF